MRANRAAERECDIVDSRRPARRLRRLYTRSFSRPSNAGSSVTAASIVTSTTMAVA